LVARRIRGDRKHPRSVFHAFCRRWSATDDGHIPGIVWRRKFVNQHLALRSVHAITAVFTSVKGRADEEIQLARIDRNKRPEFREGIDALEIGEVSKIMGVEVPWHCWTNMLPLIQSSWALSINSISIRPHVGFAPQTADTGGQILIRGERREKLVSVLVLDHIPRLVSPRVVAVEHEVDHVAIVHLESERFRAGVIREIITRWCPTPPHCR